MMDREGNDNRFEYRCDGSIVLFVMLYSVLVFCSPQCDRIEAYFDEGVERG